MGHVGLSPTLLSHLLEMCWGHVRVMLTHVGPHAWEAGWWSVVGPYVVGGGWGSNRLSPSAVDCSKGLRLKAGTCQHRRQGEGGKGGVFVAGYAGASYGRLRLC